MTRREKARRKTRRLFQRVISAALSIQEELKVSEMGRKIPRFG